jgi:hypothetical protein
VHLPLLRNTRRTLSYRITDLIAGWSHCSTNMSRSLLDVHLLFDVPHRNPGCWLHPEASQDLTVALYLHKQHTQIEIYIYSQMEITHSIIFINQILHKSTHRFEHKAYVSINYYTKNICHVSLSLWFEI